VTGKGYRARIAEITGVDDPAMVGAIEEIMRLERATLDALSARAFEREAKIALRVYLAMDEHTRQWYRAASGGGR
jgi:hypothetical protein